MAPCSARLGMRASLWEPLCAAAEAQDALSGPAWSPPEKPSQNEIPCYDPGTMQYLGTLPAMTADEARSRGMSCSLVLQRSA